MRVGVAGLGLMGASFAGALRRARPELDLIGHDVDPATLRRAVAEGLVRPGDPGTADVVVLAVPIPALPGLLSDLAGRPAVVTDMASTKARVMAWAAEAGVDLVGGHPMCGRERAGIDAADPAMFRGAPWVLTRDEPVVTDLVRSVGAVPVFMEADLHDRLVSGVSHAAFVASAAFVLALADDPDWGRMRRLAGPGFRDLSRLAGGDPALYAAIVGTNRQPIARRLRALEEVLARFRGLVESADEGALRSLFEAARRARDGWIEERETWDRAGRPGAAGRRRAGDG
ncbi:MAG TPA: prephenate dehydrogenase/arogenate dehydrogenase family protein [Candidatus Dormibacteraeota bacterium]|jgi:prephenate dehydrogenase|nr:prephenate dehydrogenase/arogenate dehydrogenase family protein [Candidatus Dormibacteraeota bacterium]